MKKIMKTAVVVCLLLVFTLILAGCIRVEMKVNKDGSCDLKYEIRTEGMIGSDEVKKQLESSINEANDEAGKNVAKLKNFKEKDGVITAEISLKDISFMGDDAFFGKLSDFEKEFPGYLDNLKEAKKGEYIAREDIKGAGKLNVVMVAGVTTTGELTEFKVILPGAVKYISSNVTLIDNNTVNVNSGYGIILYQSGGGAGWLVYLVVIALIVIVAVVIISNKGKRKASAASTAPVMNTAPVAAAVPSAPQAAPAAPAAGASEVSEDVVYCPHCGTKLKAGAKFCASCGGRVSE